MFIFISKLGFKMKERAGFINPVACNRLNAEPLAPAFYC
jgi:hypothetical protein